SVLHFPQLFIVQRPARGPILVAFELDAGFQQLLGAQQATDVFGPERWLGTRHTVLLLAGESLAGAARVVFPPKRGTQDWRRPVARRLRSGLLMKRFLFLALALAPILAAAQGYPQRPVRIIVPFPPGGSVDFIARVVAQGLTEQIGNGHQFIVDNRAGANGTI